MSATPLRRNRDFVLLQTGLVLSSAGSQWPLSPSIKTAPNVHEFGEPADPAPAT